MRAGAYRSIPVLLIVWLLAVLTTPPAMAGEPFQLTVFHVNDTHSHLEGAPLTLNLAGEKTYAQAGGFARLASLAEAEAQKGGNLIRLHAGDAFQGTLYFNKYNGAADAEMLNLLQIDVMALGNHEFDKGPGLLAEFLGRIGFSLVSANLDASGEPTLAGKVAPYAVKEIGGRKVGVIGLVTPRTAVTSSPGPSIAFTDPVEAARHGVAELTEKGVNVVIVLSHLGIIDDVALAKAVPGIDLIVGGHTHTLVGNYGETGLHSDGDYPVVIQGPDGPVPVVQAWKWGLVAGLIDLSFDDEGRLVSYKGRPVLVLADSFRRKNAEGNKVPVDDAARAAILADVEKNPSVAVMPADPAVAARLEVYKKGIESMETEVAARVTGNLLHVRVPGEVHEASGQQLTRGSQVAPIVSAAMLWKLRQVGQKADVFITNAGGVRTDLEAGDLTVGDVYRLLPFGNTIVTIRLTGAELLQALEEGWSGEGTGGRPYAAGLRYTVDPKKPDGSRIVEASIIHPDGSASPIDPKAEYLAATNAFLAGGGDGYEALAGAKGERYDTGFVQADVFMEYAQAEGALSPPEDTGVSLAE